MPMFGADIAALRGFASSLRYRQREIDATRQRLTTVVEALPWTGTDRERFVDEWRQVHNPNLAHLTGELTAAAGEADYHAGRQERASASGRW